MFLMSTFCEKLFHDSFFFSRNFELKFFHKESGNEGGKLVQKSKISATVEDQNLLVGTTIYSDIE